LVGLINKETKQPFSYNDPCVARGATVAGNSQAYGEALKAVKECLAVTFKLK